MATYWCKAADMGLAPCNNFRRRGWGVCKTCWEEKIEGHGDREVRYSTWWKEERSRLNAADASFYTSEPETKKQNIMKDSQKDKQIRDEIKVMKTEDILAEMSVMVSVLREREAKWQADL